MKNKTSETSSENFYSGEKPDTAIYSLWFGLNYGSILTAFALYKTLEEFGKRPVMLPKPKKLWTDHYAKKDSIAGLFIRKNCRVLEIFDDPDESEIFKSCIDTYVTGSDVIWNRKLLGNDIDFFMQKDIPSEKRKISVSSSFGSRFDLDEGLDNEYYHLFRSYGAVSVSDEQNAGMIKKYFDLDAKVLLDPIFLCSRQFFSDCAEKSAAKKNEKQSSFIFASVVGGDKRKKTFILKGNEVLLHKKGSVLRCMIDINSFPESEKALGLQPAFFIETEDYLYYLINSEFVLTDNVYAMYLAIIFEKPFAVMVNKDDPDFYRFKDFLSIFGLEERIVIMQDDLKTKEYLFRKPVNYKKVNLILNEMREDNLCWLKNALGVNEQSYAENVEQGEIPVGKENQL